MAIPKLKKQDVIDALKFIDKNGVPEHNTSVKYVLVSEDGKKYPPKYVVAVADHLANGTDISTESFNSDDAKNYLESLGFSIETKQQEKFELSITAEDVRSTDERFTMDNLKETAAAETEAAVQEELVQQFKGYRNPFSSMLIESKNLIFRGAPGTGKS